MSNTAPQAHVPMHPSTPNLCQHRPPPILGAPVHFPGPRPLSQPVPIGGPYCPHPHPTPTPTLPLTLFTYLGETMADGAEQTA